MLNKLRDRIGFMILSTKTKQRINEGLHYYEKALEIQRIAMENFKNQLEQINEHGEYNYEKPRILQ